EQHPVPPLEEQPEIAYPGQPAELAPAYVFLASQESSYITGETIAVTGGVPFT
ncbi:SDR family oxidoreductase, partial [Rhodococcus pyridinivorans]|uniref:SDR family oxidoreductase n=1 Tax=Rhodococcus pyridinivorans TaxID=103816 RepID=UPI0024B9DAEC